MSWYRNAACRDEDPEIFFPPTPTPQAAAQAAAVCARCPVTAQCRHDGADQGSGVWGGAGEDERRAARPKRRTAAAGRR